MKKTLTFEQLKRLVLESVLGEKDKTDIEPITIKDVPLKLMSELKDRFGATIHDNYIKSRELYVTIPLNANLSRGDSRLTHDKLHELEAVIKKAKWNIVGRFEPDSECPDYTVIISPYSQADADNALLGPDPKKK